MDSQRPAGPKGNFLLGNMRELQSDPLGFLLETAAYGDIAACRLGPQRVLLLNEAGLVQEVLIRQMKQVEKAAYDRLLLGRFLGQGILTSEGEFHRQQRRLVQPAFHARRINSYAQTMVDYTLTMMDSWRSGWRLRVDKEMMRLTMAIVSRTLFDADVSGMGGEVGAAISELQALTVKDFYRGFTLPTWLPTAHNRRIRQASATVDRAIREFISDWRATGEDKGDLLSMLLLAQDEEDGRSMTDDQVRDEAATLFSAGHETTSNALTWTWYLLSEHPQQEAKLHAELDQVLHGRPPDLDDLANLPYTEAVIKEALRLYPPAWILMGRTPAEEGVTIGGYAVETGVWIWISPYVIHRSPRYFDNPLSFEPERFLDGRSDDLPRYAYIPFGGGQRVCIGNSFAMMEARLILAAVAQRYRLRMTPGQTVVPEPEITLRIRDGLQVELSDR